MGRVQAGISAEHQAAHGQLMGIVSGHLQNGQRVPCTGRNADCWTSPDPEHTEYAAAQCQACPLLRDCRAYINQHDEPAGVWAGLTPSERKNKK